MGDSFDQKAYVKMKGQLTRALNTKDPDKILSVAKSHLTQFEKTGFPDDWHRWQRAVDDVEMQRAHGGGRLCRG